MTISSGYPLSEEPNFSSDLPKEQPQTGLPAVIGGVKTQRMLRWLGYGLFILYVVDVGYVLFPPEFTNMVWEYQTMGSLAQIVPALLISVLLIFFGETVNRDRIERQTLRVLSWITLVFAVLYFLMIPLTAVNALRINRENNSQISTQVNQQKLQLEATQEQLEQATQEQLASLIPVPDEAGSLPDAPNTPEEARDQILTRVGEARRAADDQAKEAKANLKANLIKNSVKIAAEALVAACALVYVWHLTAWARRLESYGRRTQTAAAGPAQSGPDGPNQGKRRRRRQ